jgi:hypothetical protein
MMSTVHRPTPRFKVGDWVSFQYGPRQVWAQVIEDRGSLGVNRRRLYRIRVGEESGEPAAFEVPEDDLRPAQPDREAVIEYLKQGGLLDILRANLGGGRGQPKVWLTFDSHGRLIHTFNAERGLIGGAAVPFFALHGNAVFAPKTEEVVSYLGSFGLSRDDARDVLDFVGTEP